MIFVIGASALRRAIDKAPYYLKKQLQGKVFAVPGLSLHPKVKNNKKKLQFLLETSLKERTKSFIWHDLINNSLSAHRSNGSISSDPTTLIATLEPFRQQICALVYNQRLGTPDIHENRVKAKYVTLNPRKHPLSR